MLSIAVVDDDVNDSDRLKNYIKKYFEEKDRSNGASNECHINVFDCGNEFLKAFPSGFDIVFLDIEMPGLSGLQTARQLREINANVAIVFVTNMAQYAINGYEVNALDFIVKPVNYFDFALKLKKILGYCGKLAAKQIALRLSETESAVIDSSIVEYVEVIQHYLVYHTTDGKEYRTRGTIGQAENMLVPYGFARAAKSFLVNLMHVRSVKGQEIYVGNTVVYMGRTKRDSFMEKFGRYVGGLN